MTSKKGRFGRIFDAAKRQYKDLGGWAGFTSGEWVWRDRWVWVGGYWGRRPHPNAVWVPGAWARAEHGYRKTPGHWH